MYSTLILGQLDTLLHEDIFTELELLCKLSLIRSPLKNAFLNDKNLTSPSTIGQAQASYRRVYTIMSSAGI